MLKMQTATREVQYYMSNQCNKASELSWLKAMQAGTKFEKCQQNHDRCNGYTLVIMLMTYLC